MTDSGPYTTITVEEFTRMATTIKHLRMRQQSARELLEKCEITEALNILRSEEA